ncbi:response regulator transcription factor [Flavobacteriaceae bacterium LSUCC0859]|nr:response regulator transcription factor [Flavobacteriaceae bacterium LSUCC0859]
MINILIADNHPIIRLGMSVVFESTEDFSLLDTVSHTEALFNALEKTNPDIVILELDIPEINGIAALRRLKRHYPNIKVLIYSAQPENVYALSCIKAGAYGYLPKTARIDQILTALHQISQGKIYLSSAIATTLKSDASKESENQIRFKKLSSREVEVLKLLSSGKKNKEVAEGLDINEKTVSTYKARLMKKLGVSNIVDLLQQARALELY